MDATERLHVLENGKKEPTETRIPQTQEIEIGFLPPFT
jgi:hypothetical protein